jgi:hypothetical protein
MMCAKKMTSVFLIKVYDTPLLSAKLLSNFYLNNKALAQLPGSAGLPCFYNYEI